MLQEIGVILAVGGSALTVFGTIVNNQLQRHRLAMKFWGVSNPALLSWAAGYLLGLWDVGLTMVAIMAMYLIFTVSNWSGLLKFRGRGLM